MTQKGQFLTMPFQPKAKMKTEGEKPKATLTVTLKWMGDNERQVKEAAVIRDFASRAGMKPTSYVYGCLHHAINTGPIVDSASEYEEAVRELQEAQASKDKAAIDAARELMASTEASLVEQYGEATVKALEALAKSVA